MLVIGDIINTNECISLESSNINEISITPKEYYDILNIQQVILNMIASKSTTESILSELCILAESLLTGSVASIMMRDEETGLMSVISAPSIPEVGHKALENLKPGPGGGSCGNAVFRNKAQYVVDTFTDERWNDIRQVAIDFDLRSCWSMPIRDEDGNSIGSFALSSFENRLPASFHKKLLQSATLMISIALKNKSIDEEIKYMTYHDRLTNLYNKSFLEKTLHHTQAYTLLLIDVNNFSYINAAYGFEIGDKLLKNIAMKLQEKFETQSVCRINSDEFAILYSEEIDIKNTISDIQNYF